MKLLHDILRRDTDIAAEISERAAGGRMHAAESTFIDPLRVDAILAGTSDTAESPIYAAEEAVVLWEARPSLLIKDDAYSLPNSPLWRERLAAAQGALRGATLATGRIELVDHPLNALTPFIGTGWLIAENVIVTNRHVAHLFVESHADRLVFVQNPQTNGPTEVRIDFKEEHGSDAVSAREVGLTEVIAVEAVPGADMAFLRIRKNTNLPSPIELVNEKADEFIAAIGYPGRDQRADPAKLAEIFDGGYGVKRLAPGQIMPGGEGFRFFHDASTLKGSSGSVIVSLETGKAVGLHFAGRFGERNEAVNAAELKRRLTKLDILPKSLSLTRPPPERAPEPDESADVEGRDGYNANFLGDGAEVPLPGIRDQHAVGPLDYTHFSIVMHDDRKFAICAASNVDGNELRRVPRDNSWRLDGRIGIDGQHGNELYRRNDYDRGHLVRRLAPVWGDRDEAERANDDTFFYTNSAPQHGRLNQKFWLGLEDYILDNARTTGLKISVFNGCVFDNGDPKHRGVAIPRQFWKIVAFREAGASELRASGYLMDQSHLIADMPEESAFGAYKTYQVSISRIERTTGLDMLELRNADVLRTDTESFALMPITSFAEVQF